MSTALSPSPVPPASAAITVGPLPPCPAADPVATSTTAQLPTNPAARPVPSSASAPSPRLEVFQAWPRSAQWATAFLLGVAVALIAMYSLSHLRSGSRPLDLERGAVLSYRVDLNRAGREELLQLPGIGPNMADRIEDYRRASGGFRSVEDLTRIKGFGPAALERLRPWVIVEQNEETILAAPQPRHDHAPAKSSAAASKSKKLAALTGPIDVNHASVEELQKLPGIGPKLSQRILDAREKVKFRTVEELRRVPGIGPKTLERLRPYVTVQKESIPIATAESSQR
jgi:competence protein ComEA